MAVRSTSAKFLFTDINPADVVPVTVPALENLDEPPQILHDPHVDYAGTWVLDGFDGDSYVYREQLEDTVTPLEYGA